MDFRVAASYSPIGLWNDLRDGGEKYTMPRNKWLRDLDSVRKTHINDLPGAVLTSIFSMVTNPRSRNSMSLACKDWYYLERQTRSSLTLRGNLCDPESLPVSFKNVTNLDLSYCSPWGYSIFQSPVWGQAGARLLHNAFPNVKDLAIYVRDAFDIQMVVWLWPELESLRLVRWHQRAMELGLGLETGSEVEPLLKCQKLRKLDLSAFYCWTEDILPALESGTMTAANLVSLNLLKISPEGFKAQEIRAITAACRNLEELFLLCEFDLRFLDSVGDKALDSIASNCPGLRVLHLVDNNEWGVRSSDIDDGDVPVDASVTRQGLQSMFRKLPKLQDLALLLAQNVWGTGQALEALFTSCPELSSLHLSHFQEVCIGFNDGMAMGKNLTELSIKDCDDLSDDSLASITRGCRTLKKLSLKGCRQISEKGVSDCVRALSLTLVDVEIVSCKRLPAVETLRALEPIRNSIQRLHMDCVWDDAVIARQAAAAAVVTEATRTSSQGDCLGVETVNQAPRLLGRNINRRGKDSLNVQDSNNLEVTRNGIQQLNRQEDLIDYGDGCEVYCNRAEASGRGELSSRSSCSSEVFLDGAVDEVAPSWGGNASSSGTFSSVTDQAPDERCWSSLQTLSLWIGVGLLISPLPLMGLGRCPVLKEVSIRVEGDCKSMKRPVVQWGLASFSRYKSFTKLNMDLGDVVSFSLSAPEGTVDLSIWERHYLSGISELKLQELDYRPPCDKDLNHRGLSLPAVGHLSQCLHIRKLIVHGSVHEHFLSMLNRNPSLRDFQLRWDFYPAPEYETTEIRVESCKRFEAALAERGFPD